MQQTEIVFDDNVRLQDENATLTEQLNSADEEIEARQNDNAKLTEKFNVLIGEVDDFSSLRRKPTKTRSRQSSMVWWSSTRARWNLSALSTVQRCGACRKSHRSLPRSNHVKMLRAQVAR